MPVIATAGHVDHGKSALVQALTGTDPDRLREEKERGLTIDLGFAELRLPSGADVSIIDVPGHERFIKNMLAGVGGIDLALLVVAADEGVMPQTREHLAIIDLLGVGRGVIALTKEDLVDDASVAAEEVRELIAETTLAAAPIIPCSAVTRAGLDELLAAIEGQLADAPERHDFGIPRLPIDRAFTMTGFGTVVTGTLVDGSLKVGQEVEVLPTGPHARIRGLQNHGRQVQEAAPGRRTAVNLAGISVEELRRGIVLALPGTVRATTAVDVRLRAVPYLAHPLRHNTTVSFHTGAAEVEARLSLLETDALGAGETAWAQLRFAEPVVVLHDDRFIIRDPNGTLGGGTVADVDVRRHRRHHASTIAALEAVASGSTPATPEIAASPAPRALTKKEQRAADEYLALIRAAAFSPPVIGSLPAAALQHLVEHGEIVRVSKELAFAAEAYETMVSRVADRLRTDGPLTLAEARDLLGTSRRYAQALLEHMDSKRITKRVGEARVLR